MMLHTRELDKSYAAAYGSTLLRTRKLEIKIVFLRSGVEIYAVAYQKVWSHVFFSF